MARSKSVANFATVLVMIGLLTALLRLIGVLKVSWLIALSPFIATFCLLSLSAFSTVLQDRIFSAKIDRSGGRLPKSEIGSALRKRLLIAGVQKDLAYDAFLAGEIDLSNFGNDEFDRESVARLVSARYLGDPVFFWEMVDRGIVVLVDRELTQVTPVRQHTGIIG